MVGFWLHSHYCADQLEIAIRAPLNIWNQLRPAEQICKVAVDLVEIDGALSVDGKRSVHDLHCLNQQIVHQSAKLLVALHIVRHEEVCQQSVSLDIIVESHEHGRLHLLVELVSIEV